MIVLWDHILESKLSSISLLSRSFLGKPLRWGGHGLGVLFAFWGEEGHTDCISRSHLGIGAIGFRLSSATPRIGPESNFPSCPINPGACGDQLIRASLLRPPN